MASLDFVTDLTDKLIKQNIDFVVITVQKGKQGNRTHVFHRVTELDSLENIAKSIVSFSDILKDKAQIFSNSKIKKNKKPKKNDEDSNDS